MQIHASCAARNGAGVLLIGPSGSGKSDLLLRLLDRGFALVADDRVEIDCGVARAPAPLAGLLEIRGLGIVREPFEPEARLVLAIAMRTSERLPLPDRYLGLPLIHIDPTQPSAPARVAAALRIVMGERTLLEGALA